jgi:hypothetical protein
LTDVDTVTPSLKTYIGEWIWKLLEMLRIIW